LATVLFCSCNNYGQLEVIAKLPKSLKESSGLATLNATTVWTIEDNGNKDAIYNVDFEGNILKKFKVKNAKNTDWEDLTTDRKKNLYIGDFGNNSNKRKDLVIYKLPNPETEPGDKIDAEKIEFRYPDQKDFPPKKADRIYDAEALFHHGTSLYIFTKNRAKPFTGLFNIYRVPDTKGTYEATLLGILTFCKDWDTCQITSVAISPDATTIVALSYGKLFILKGFSFDDFTQGSVETIDLGSRSQLEAVCFLDANTLVLSDEASHGMGGNLYKFILN